MTVWRRRDVYQARVGGIGYGLMLAGLLLGLLSGPGAVAAELRLAAAANFKQTAEQLCEAFAATQRVRCMVSSGSSGLLYGKIVQGAPFDVFMSADRERPERLEREGLAVAGSRLTYAIGQLVFWRPGHRLEGSLGSALAGRDLASLAIANPGAAPYGAAAMDTLRALGIDPAKRYRLVQGESVAQAFQFVASGAAEAGFVSRAQVLQYERNTGRNLAGELLVVAPDLHRPIEQQAVLLRSAGDRAIAAGFMRFLKSKQAAALIEAAGYTVPTR